MKKLLLTLLLMISAIYIQAQTPYAIWCEGNSTLYFINDSKNYKAGDIYKSQTITEVWNGNTITNSGNSNPAWKGTVYSKLQKVVFDTSFASITPNSLYGWFIECNKLTTITGIEYLNTSNVENMSDMFSGCSGLKILDVSHFDTSKVEDMSVMF